MLNTLRQFVNQSPMTLWATAIAIFTAAELLAGQPIPWRRRLVNLINGSAVLLTLFFVGPAIAATLHWVKRTFGLVYNPPFMLDLYVPYPPLAALLFLLAYDLGYYWFHRAQHATPLLWRVHAVHHSETDLNATSYLRQHFTESALQSFAIMVPLLLVVSVLPRTMAWVAILSAFVQFFAHSALPIHFGPLSAVVISPRLHRIHHSAASAEKLELCFDLSAVGRTFPHLPAAVVAAGAHWPAFGRTPGRPVAVAVCAVSTPAMIDDAKSTNSWSHG
jgi:sterol desaturase/sphingolipid hydroxylase (fatty acid hydroxylase superfamily)